MTEAAKQAKPFKDAKVGETCICPRCGGKGNFNTRVMYNGCWGNCFRCGGWGVIVKEDLTRDVSYVIYKVKNEQTGHVHLLNSSDTWNKDVPTSLWLGDKVSYRRSKDCIAVECVIVGKLLTVINGKTGETSEKKSKGYDQIEWL